MAHFQLYVLFGLGLFITLINGECVVDFQNGTVFNNGSTCYAYSESILNKTLTCSGIQLSDVSQGNLSNLKAFSDSAFDLYTLLRSRLDVSLVVSSINNVRSNGPKVGALSDVDFARLWFQVKLNPFLSSLSRDTLSCLSQSNLSCLSFQALVKDLSLRIGPERRRMVYQNFIKPFLKRNTSDAGCVKSVNSTDQWILQNFQNFSVIASLGDLKDLKQDFDGLAALYQLSPEQKAELIFQLETNGSLNFDAINKIFLSFLQPLTNMTLNMTRVTSVGLDKNLTDFLVYLRPLGRFIRSCVTTAQTANISSFRNETIRLLVNWTLSFDSNLNQTSINTFDISNFSVWFQNVVRPAMKKYLNTNQTLPDNVTEIATFVFAPEPQIADPVDICKVTSNNSSCLISQNGESLAKAVNCVAQSNLNFTEENLRLLITGLSKPLQVINSSQSNLTALFAELPAESFTPGNLDDVEFMPFWFQMKMKPLLPNISKEFLSCLRIRSFSCQAYKALFVAINNSGLMDNAKNQLIVSDFIVPFLSQRQNTSVDCTVPFKNSLDFIQQNFGNFFQSAQLQDVSKLSRNFSALEVLSALTSKQLDELVFSPPASPEERTNIFTKVFDFLLQDTNRDKLNGFIPSLQTQARKANFSCANYKIFFDKIDQIILSAPSNRSEDLLKIRDSVMMIPPDECIDRAGQCQTPVNESSLCASVNSSALDQFLKEAAPNSTDPLKFCNFTVLEFACRQTLPQLSAQQVADVLTCKSKQSSGVGKESWKLFFIKTSSNLDDALLKFSNMTPSPGNMSLSDVLDALVDARVDRFSPQRLSDPVFIRSWFQERLKPFLPSVSPRVLSCLSKKKTLTCKSYRTIVEAFVNASLQDRQDVCRPLQPNDTQKQDLIYTEFMKAFLSRNDTDDPGCLNDTTNSTQWVNRNFGPIVQSANLTDLNNLNRNFTAVEVLPLLSLKQLVEFSVTAGALKDRQSVINIMQLVKDCQLPAFFDGFSPSVQANLLSPDVKEALIKQIFDRANLSNINITDQEIKVWFQNRLNPLLANFSESLVSPFFTILGTRDCNITQFGLGLLGAVRSSVPTKAIYNSILQSFRGPQPLRCYRNNSFITFLNESLFSFGPLPNLTTFLSLMPQSRKSELINSISPSELGTYLRQLEVVNNDSQICVIFNNFVRTPEFLDTEEVPDNLKSTILPCVWPLALTSDNQTVVDLWFDRRLRLYLKFLNKDLLGSKDTLNASCLSYRKMVNVLGNNFTFSGSQISKEDVYNTIKTYLKADSAPKCYNSDDAALNSTAWFVNHIGIFITFLSLDDLYSFGPDTTIQKFTVNTENVNLFNVKTLPKDVLSRYTELLFLQNPNYDLFALPSVLQCDAPVSAFTKINESQTYIILGNLNSSCSKVDPAISTALAGNIKTIDANAISKLGNEVVGLTAVQINSASPSVLISVLSTLSSVSGWGLGQAKAIIRVLLRGNFQFNSFSSLVNLGSLIGGIPSTVLTTIAPEQILLTKPEFVKNILSAPEIVQKTLVTQIIKLGSSSTDLIKNIPSEMAVHIPRNLMNIKTTLDPSVLKEFINKSWKPEQAVLFFDSVANAFEQPDDLSVEVLQGFTCSRVNTFTQTKVRGLIKACRRRKNRPKVVLSETQLTCMYNLVRTDSVVDFASYHPDMLLYFNYETINKTFCKAYFAEVGAADLSIFSRTLRGRRDILWKNALDCFGINGTSITKQDLAVLGNLACAANSTFIEKSDPEILENLKNCTDLTDAQINAMETVLMNGISKYGPKSKWNQRTLGDLGVLPLYFSQNFWGSFKESDLSKFLKSFLKFVRVRNTPKPQLKRLFKAIILPVKKVAKRAACTKDSITSAIISDDAFPFGYDELQFSNCLSAEVVRDNLASLCEKIEDSAFQRTILNKLSEISPSGLSEDQVQLLKSVSRNATADEISKWNITTVDTLAALMNANDGEWSSNQSKQIITKYLSANNNLTATELNTVKGPNLCSLNASILSTILPESIRGADALNVLNCSSDNKKALFTIANKAFPMPTVRASSEVLSVFQLIEPYLGGADLAYIRNLSLYNVSMSLSTFINLDPNVTSKLTVPEVVGLLGLNLQDLKTFENETVVLEWISLQFQSELDKLNLGLKGGKADLTTAPPAATTTATATTAATIKITSDAPGIGRSGWSVSLSILVFIFAIIKVEII
ncbi:uncharacterized protein mslna [Pseudorasbora parva]|uniref:uncharacterized protein mslna n=1 Tax=Pseudorasbora parva TaxID=51549 RepID=UPI00351F46F3